jgi:hypothetical protein
MVLRSRECIHNNITIDGGPTHIKDPLWNRLPLLAKTGECDRNDISGVNAGQLSNFYTQFCDSIADENASLTKVIIIAMPSPHQTRTNTGVHLLETRSKINRRLVIVSQMARMPSTSPVLTPICGYQILPRMMGTSMQPKRMQTNPQNHSVLLTMALLASSPPQISSTHSELQHHSKFQIVQQIQTL